MAIYHLSATPIQRSKGHSAIAAAAYRAGEKLHDERLGQEHDYTRKRGVVQSEILAPENAPDWIHDRSQLWNKAEFAERQYNGQPAREIRLALPNELTDGQRAELVFEYCREAFVSKGIVADISIHRPDRSGDKRNHHAHILLTMRELDGDGFARTKQREWNKETTLQEWRQLWEEHQNHALEEAGSDERVDHRSFSERGISLEPTIHEGEAATALERRGEPSDRSEINRRIRDSNHERAQLASEVAGLEAEIHVEETNQKALRNDFLSPTAQPSEAPLTWEEQKAAARSAFNSDIVQAYVKEIQETGTIREYGLGRNWYDRTMAMFENLYSITTEYVRDTWSRYVYSRDNDIDR